MNKKEKRLFIELCKFKNKKENFNEVLAEYASPEVLGHIFFNRMQAVAYNSLIKYEILNKVNREFRNSLKSAYEKNIVKNESFYKCVEEIYNIIKPLRFKVAMLKGAELCAEYPKGFRTSNDLDLLVLSKNITKLSERLLKNGFKQGSIKNGEFVPAERKEIIESKMTRGETVPFIKEVNLPEMQFFEVDINFSLGFKNEDEKALNKMLKNTTEKDINNKRIITLNDEDFFIHLCGHLYKEATALPWIEMHRDMTLYKYADIYLLMDRFKEGKISKLFLRAKELNMDKMCAFAILQTAELFNLNNMEIINFAKYVLREEPDFIYKAVNPKTNEILTYKTKNVTELFFDFNRKNELLNLQNTKDNKEKQKRKFGKYKTREAIKEVLANKTKLTVIINKKEKNKNGI